MTNQDEKPESMDIDGLRKWIRCWLPSSLCKDLDLFEDKARQQGIDNTIIECEKKKELWIDRERKSVYEQGKKDGMIAVEREKCTKCMTKISNESFKEGAEEKSKKIIEVIEKWIEINYWDVKGIPKRRLKEILEKLKNSEA